MSDEIVNIIAQGAKELNINLPPEAGAAFKAYSDFLEKRGQVVNLTAISGAGEIARMHFLDSIALLNAIDFKSAKVIDIGSGAGFPGLPLKIADSSVDITLLDATGKRITFLSELSTVLGIETTCINARAEEAAHEPDKREQYDIAVSRAVARLNVLCELCLPFINIGGFFLAMKSVDSIDETREANNAIDILGAVYKDHYDYRIPGTDIIHRVIIIEKKYPTPDKYPRRNAKIQKAPL